jgi:hypothetical protein
VYQGKEEVVTGPDGKTHGYTPSGVRDSLGKGGVALLGHLRIEGTSLGAPDIAAKLFPEKRKNGSAMIFNIDKQADVFTCDVLIGAAKQQIGLDIVRAGRRVCPQAKVTYTTTAGVLCSPTADMPGSPRAGSPWTSRQRKDSPHR